MTEADVHADTDADTDADNVIACCICPSLRMLMMDPIFVHTNTHS